MQIKVSSVWFNWMKIRNNWIWNEVNIVTINGLDLRVNFIRKNSEKLA